MDCFGGRREGATGRSPLRYTVRALQAAPLRCSLRVGRPWAALWKTVLQVFPEAAADLSVGGDVGDYAVGAGLG